MSVSFRPGFAEPALPILAQMTDPVTGENLGWRAMQRIKASGATTVRFDIYWDNVEGSYPGQGNWGIYATIGAWAQQLALKIHPVIFGAPGWIPLAERERCHPECVPGYPANPSQQLYCSNNPWASAFWYPKPSRAADYAEFCFRVVEYFRNNCGQIIDTLEVWNEPNLYSNLIYIWDRSAFNHLLAATISRLRSYDPAFRVVSGGLYLDFNNPGVWKNYLDGFVNQCYPYGLGVHPYDLRNGNENSTGSQNAAQLVNRVRDLYDNVVYYLLSTHGISTQPLYVTETGAPSRDFYGQGGQQAAIAGLVAPSGIFQARSNLCKMVLLYRLYPYSENDSASNESLGKPFYKFSLLRNGDWASKPAYNDLNGYWT